MQATLQISWMRTRRQPWHHGGDSSGEYQPSKPETDSSDGSEYVDDHRALLVDGCPIFVVTITESHFTGTLKIPFDFWNLYIRIGALQAPIYFIDAEVTWRMAVEYSNSKIWIAYGWKRFRKAIDFKLGIVAISSWLMGTTWHSMYGLTVRRWFGSLLVWRGRSSCCCGNNILELWTHPCIDLVYPLFLCVCVVNLVYSWLSCVCVLVLVVCVVMFGLSMSYAFGKLVTHT